MEDAEVVATLTLSLVPGIGAQRLRDVVRAFGSARGALDAPHHRITLIPGFSKAAATAIKSANPDDGVRVLERLATLGARVLLPGATDFPPQLEEIRDPPAVLYVWGDASLLTRPGVAFVGTDNGLMVALDTQTGRRLWSFTAPNKVACGPAIVGNEVVMSGG